MTTADELDTSPGRKWVLRRGDWKPLGDEGLLSIRRVRRVIIVIVLSVLALSLVMLLWTPFWHPNTHMFLIKSSDSDVLTLPLSYASSDFEALTELRNALYTHEDSEDSVAPLRLPDLHTTADIQALVQRLESESIGPRDVLIVYVIAHGVSDHETSDDGIAYLLCGSFDSVLAPLERIRFDNLLRRISQTPAATKLLILDAGRIQSSPRDGIIVNEFISLVERDVRRISDENVWVLCSHAPFQRARDSVSLRRSPFGFCISRGLRGAADSNGDYVIGLNELFGYVSDNVSIWVRRTSGTDSFQTPRLFRGGGSTRVPDRFPALLSIDSLPNAITDESGKSVEQIQQEEDEAGQVSGIAELVWQKSGAKHQFYQSTAVQKGLAAQRVTAKVRPAGGGGQRELQPDVPDSTTDDESTDQDSDQDDAESPAVNDTEATGIDGADGENAGPADSKPASSTSLPMQRIADLLDEGWRLRDTFRQPTDGLVQPSRYAPHLWNAFQHKLIGYETRFLAGQIEDPETFATEVENIILPLRELAGEEVDVIDMRVRQVDRRIVEMAPDKETGTESLFTIGLYQLLSREAFFAANPDLDEVIARFDELLNGDSLEPLRTWMDQIAAPVTRLAELRLAEQLLAEPSMDWETCQLALKTRRLAEQVATHSISTTPWVSARVNHVDRLRWEGERKLLDRIGANRKQQARILLREAGAHYENIQTDLQLIGSAITTANDLLHRAPDYVRWYVAATPGANPPLSEQDLVRMLDILAEMLDAMGRADPADLQNVVRMANKLSRLRRNIESSLQPERLEAMSDLPSEAGDSRKITNLLRTPFLNLAQRRLLSSSLPEIDSNLLSRTQLSSGAATKNPFDTSSRNGIQIFVRHAILQVKLAHLIDITHVGGTHDVSMDATVQRIARSKFDPSQQDVYLRTVRNIENWLSNYYQQLPALIAETTRRKSNLVDPTTRSRRIQNLLAANRLLNLVDPHDVDLIEQINPARAVRNSRLHDLLSWHHHRFLAAQVDASPRDVEYYQRIANQYRTLGESIPLQPKITAARPSQLEIVGSHVLSLTANPQGVMEFLVRRDRLQRQDVWIVLDYDSEIVHLTTPPGRNIYTQSQLAETSNVPIRTADSQVHDTRFNDSAVKMPIDGANADAGHLDARANQYISDEPPTNEELGRLTAYPYRPQLATQPATFTADDGIVEPLTIRIRVKEGAEAPTKLIVKAVTKSQYIRHEVDLVLPQQDYLAITAAGTTGSWSTNDRGIALHPFPNRATEYGLRIANQLSHDRIVDVELLATDSLDLVSLPKGAIPIGDIGNIRQEIHQSTSLWRQSKLTLPADGVPVALPFAGVAGAGTEQSSVDESDLSDTDAEAEAENDVGGQLEDSTSLPIPSEMLLVITDRDPRLVSLKRINIKPQHPRRYLLPQVGYNVNEQQIQIRVRPLSEPELPPGRVRIRAEIPGLSADAEARLTAELKAPEYSARMYARVEPRQGRELKVLLHVDEYPRAFTFNVRCDAHRADIPQSSNAMFVQVTEPAQDESFATGSGPVNVKLKVDAPVGAFDAGTAAVDVGFDPDLDREFLDEPTLRLLSERQVSASVSMLGANGRLLIDTLVDDFEFQLPPPGIRNSRVGVLARLRASGRTAWSAPVNVVFDAAPPRIGPIELMPDRIVPVGELIDAYALIHDGQLSGVESVEMQLDKERSGQFQGEPVNATMGEDGRWHAALDTNNTPLGRYNILLRARDAVGNESRILRVPVQIVEAETAAENNTNKVYGTVVFGDRGIPDVLVTLQSTIGKRIGQVRTDVYGNFTFPKVPAGEFSLVARRLLYNKNRVADVTLSVEPPPAKVPPVKLRLW